MTMISSNHTPKISQKQTLTSTDAHAPTPITAAVTDVLIRDPETSPQFTAINTNMKAEKSSVTTKGDEPQNGLDTIARSEGDRELNFCARS